MYRFVFMLLWVYYMCLLVFLLLWVYYQGRIQDLWLGGGGAGVGEGSGDRRPQRVQGRALVGGPRGESPLEALGV